MASYETPDVSNQDSLPFVKQLTPSVAENVDDLAERREQRLERQNTSLGATALQEALMDDERERQLDALADKLPGGYADAVQRLDDADKLSSAPEMKSTSSSRPRFFPPAKPAAEPSDSDLDPHMVVDERPSPEQITKNRRHTEALRSEQDSKKLADILKLPEGSERTQRLAQLRAAQYRRQRKRRP